MTETRVRHEGGETVLSAEVVDVVPADAGGTAPALNAAAAAINFQQPRAATVADVVCELHKCDPRLAERAMRIHEKNAAHVHSMDVRNQDIADRDQKRIGRVETIGACVLPFLAVLFAASIGFMVVKDAPWVAYVMAMLGFGAIAAVVKAKAENIRVSATVGRGA